MRVLIAPQEFKGTLTGREAAEAIARGICSARPDWELDVAPLADGGPGTMEALLAVCGGERRSAQVEDPLGRPVDAAFAILADRERTAVVEMAQASGLWRLARHELDAERASTFGAGQLVRAALEAGCRRILVGAGGSATNDGGAGAVEALGARLLDDSGQPLPRGGAALARFARVVAETTGRDLSAQEGAGAAGGFAFGLVALAGARIAGGFEEVSRALDLPRRLAWADVAITGEGRLDD